MLPLNQRQRKRQADRRRQAAAASAEQQPQLSATTTSATIPATAPGGDELMPITWPAAAAAAAPQAAPAPAPAAPPQGHASSTWQPSTTLGLEQAALALGGEEPGFRLLRLDVMRWLLDIETMNIETQGAASAAPGTLLSSSSSSCCSRRRCRRCKWTRGGDAPM